MNSKYNFNYIIYKDLRKFLSKKLEREGWDLSNASSSDISYFVYGKRIQYGFPFGENIKEIIFTILQKKYDFILDFSIEPLNWENFHLKKLSRKETPNILIKKIENLKDYIKNDDKYILQKNIVDPLYLDNRRFELRVYVLIIRNNNLFFNFYHPSFFVQTGEEINVDFNVDDIILDDIHDVIYKTSNVITNYFKNACSIYLLERHNENVEISYENNLQYSLIALDIGFNKNYKPYLLDIILEPVFGLLKNTKLIQREKSKIYSDIFKNFIFPSLKHKSFDLQSSSFNILNKVRNNIPINIFYTLKIFDNGGKGNDDGIDVSSLDYTDKITNSGENLVKQMLEAKIKDLKTDNNVLINGFHIDTNIEKPIILMNDYLLEEKISSFDEEIIEEKLYLKKKNNLLKNILYLTPWIGSILFAKKTYDVFNKGLSG